ncbi:MAG: DegV family protein [Lachnospiraceae bacterium]
MYNYKIVVDSCCELPEELKKDERFESIPLGLEIGEYSILDDETFDQIDFLERVAKSHICAKSSCPSPERYLESFKAEVERIYVVTLSSHLSGSNNSAILGKTLYEESNNQKNIHIIDSHSASAGETSLALYAMELEEENKYTFEEIVEKLEKHRDEMVTLFVLDNLETLRKNGRLSGIKAVVASTLNIKPIMKSEQGVIAQMGQAIGIKKALAKLAEYTIANAINPSKKRLVVTHCNNRDRAEKVKELILKETQFKDVLIMNTGGLSTLYANDGGVIIAI